LGGPDLEGQGQGRQNWLRAGPDRPVDSLFVDAYNKGLDGKWAAWANKKYRGHRVLPDNLMRDLEEAKSS